MIDQGAMALPPQHTHLDKPLSEQIPVTPGTVKETGVDLQNKLVSPMQNFPGDSAFISEEAKRAFEERERIARREEAEAKYVKEQKERIKKDPQGKQQRKGSRFYQAYQQAKQSEQQE